MLKVRVQDIFFIFASGTKILRFYLAAAQVARWGYDVVCGQSGGVGLVRGRRFLLASNDNGERAHKYEGASGYNFEGRLFAEDNERQNDSKNDA